MVPCGKQASLPAGWRTRTPKTNLEEPVFEEPGRRSVSGAADALVPHSSAVRSLAREEEESLMGSSEPSRV